jgi:hypothetical protein
MKKTTLFISALLITTIVMAQGELDQDDKIFYRDEKTGGINLNSNGFSLNFRYGKRLDGYNKRIYLIDLSVIKDAKEDKQLKTGYPNYGRFAYGKQNLILSLKSGMGSLHEIYSKRDKSGISIRRFYLYGATLAFEKPIYYEIEFQGVTTVETFNPNIHRIDNVVGKASLFQGMDEASVIPGVYASYGYSFEYSRKKGNLKAIEIGIMGELYLREIIIMANDTSKPWFVTLFLTYRFGKVMSAFN